MRRLSDEAWLRHANPWSVWTRFAAVPAIVAAVWSRAWIGAWALAPVAAVIAWLVINPVVFRPVSIPHGLAARGIYGERLWLRERARVPRGHRAVLRLLIVLGLAGFGFIAWGLLRLTVWPTMYGGALVVLAQL